QNYPNPFNPVTVIAFSLPKDEMVKVIIYNILGKEVKMLLNEELAAGTYSLTFSAEEFPSGVYFYRLSTPSVSMAKKMILEK
ncbi:MAG: T9SS type A sorting domain-containing protein, partial [Syntrophomonadaceae bacterium]